MADPNIPVGSELDRQIIEQFKKLTGKDINPVALNDTSVIRRVMAGEIPPELFAPTPPPPAPGQVPPTTPLPPDSVGVGMDNPPIEQMGPQLPPQPPPQQPQTNYGYPTGMMYPMPQGFAKEAFQPQGDPMVLTPEQEATTQRGLEFANYADTQNPLSMTTPQDYVYDELRPEAERGVIGKTWDKMVAGTSGGTSAFVSLIKGEPFGLEYGRQVEQAERDAIYKIAKQNISEGIPLLPDELVEMSSRKGFREEMKLVAKYIMQNPGEFSLDVIEMIAREGPGVILTSKGIGVFGKVALKLAQKSKKASRVLTNLKKITPEKVKKVAPYAGAIAQDIVADVAYEGLKSRDFEAKDVAMATAGGAVLGGGGVAGKLGLKKLRSMVPDRVGPTELDISLKDGGPDIGPESGAEFMQRYMDDDGGFKVDEQPFIGPEAPAPKVLGPEPLIGPQKGPKVEPTPQPKEALKPEPKPESKPEPTPEPKPKIEPEKSPELKDLSKGQKETLQLEGEIGAGPLSKKGKLQRELLKEYPDDITVPQVRKFFKDKKNRKISNKQAQSVIENIYDTPISEKAYRSIFEKETPEQALYKRQQELKKAKALGPKQAKKAERRRVKEKRLELKEEREVLRKRLIEEKTRLEEETKFQKDYEGVAPWTGKTRFTDIVPWSGKNKYTDVVPWSKYKESAWSKKKLKDQTLEEGHTEFESNNKTIFEADNTPKIEYDETPGNVGKVKGASNVGDMIVGAPGLRKAPKEWLSYLEKKSTDWLGEAKPLMKVYEVYRKTVGKLHFDETIKPKINKVLGHKIVAEYYMQNHFQPMLVGGTNLDGKVFSKLDPKQQNNLKEYLVAKRIQAIYKSQDGKKLKDRFKYDDKFFTRARVDEAVNRLELPGNEVILDRAKDMVIYNKQLLQERFVAGRIEEDEFNDLWNEKYYVPLKRDFKNITADKRGASLIERYSSSEKGILGFRNFENLDLPIIHPFASMMEATTKTYGDIAKAEVWQRMVEIVKKTPALQDKFYFLEDPDILLGAGQGRVPARVKGQLEWWAVPIEVEKALLQMGTFGDRGINRLSRFMKGWAGLVKVGATRFSPSFASANPFIDQGDAHLIVGKLPFHYMGRALKSVITKDKHWQKFLSEGRMIGGAETGAKQLQSNVDKMMYTGKWYGEYEKLWDAQYWRERYLAKHGAIPKGAVQYAGPPAKLNPETMEFEFDHRGAKQSKHGKWMTEAQFRGLQTWEAGKMTLERMGHVFGFMSDLGENTSRIATQRWATDKKVRGTKERLFSEAQVTDITRNASFDFDWMGMKARDVNQFVPFFNVTVRGPVVIGQAIKENPVRIGATAVGLGLLPAISLLTFNARNEYYKDVTFREKKDNWIIFPTMGQEYYKIPKSHYMKMMINYPMMWMEYMMGITHAPPEVFDLERTGKDLVSGFAPPALKEVVQQLYNQDFYFDKQISYEGLDADQKFDSRSSETGKWIGEHTGIGAQRVEHLGRSILASTFSDIMLAVDLATQQKKLKDIEKKRLPLLKRFVGTTEDFQRPVLHEIRKKRMEIAKGQSEMVRMTLQIEKQEMDKGSSEKEIDLALEESSLRYERTMERKSKQLEVLALWEDILLLDKNKDKVKINKKRDEMDVLEREYEVQLKKINKELEKFK